MIEVDAKKCTGCGFCADECPAGVFMLRPAHDGSRTAQVSYPSHCTCCGHCVAICPAGAVVHEKLPVDKFEDRPHVAIAPEAMRAFLLSRRSVRTFQDKPVSGDLIEQLIEVGTHGGDRRSGTENQPQRPRELRYCREEYGDARHESGPGDVLGRVPPRRGRHFGKDSAPPRGP